MIKYHVQKQFMRNRWQAFSDRQYHGNYQYYIVVTIMCSSPVEKTYTNYNGWFHIFYIDNCRLLAYFGYVIITE